MRLAVAAILAVGLPTGPLPGFLCDSVIWDSSGSSPASPVDGGGTWDTSTSLWSFGGSDNPWNNANDDTAVFGNGGTGGAVSLATGITVGGLTFNAPGYSVTGNTLSLGQNSTFTANSNATIGSVIVLTA